MKYLTSMVWIILFFQILGFIASSLTKTVYNPFQIFIVSIIFGFIFCVLPIILENLTKKE